MHLGIVHRDRGTEQGIGAAEVEFQEALPLASSSENDDMLGDGFMNLALLLRDDKADERGARKAAMQAAEAYASVGSEKESQTRQLLEDLTS
jgi:hypothetical protein